MTLIRNLSSKHRLLLSLLFFACTAGIILFVINSMGANSKAPPTGNQAQHDPAVRMARMLGLANQNRALALTAVQYNPRNAESVFIEEPFSSLRPQVEQNLAELDQIIDAYLASSLSNEEQLLLNRVASYHQAFVEKGLTPLFEAVEHNRFDEATEVFYRQLEPAFARYREGLNHLEQLQSARTMQQE